jgi:hypothetical protein
MKLPMKRLDGLKSRQLAARGLPLDFEPRANAALVVIERRRVRAPAFQASFKGSEPGPVLDARVQHRPVV